MFGTQGTTYSAIMILAKLTCLPNAINPFCYEESEHNRLLLLCMDNETRRDIYDIPLVMIYKGRGLVDIVDVIEVMERAMQRSEGRSILLKQCLEAMQSKLQEVSGRTV